MLKNFSLKHTRNLVKKKLVFKKSKTISVTPACIKGRGKNWTGDQFWSRKGRARMDGRQIFGKNWTGDEKNWWTGETEISPVLLYGGGYTFFV